MDWPRQEGSERHKKTGSDKYEEKCFKYGFNKLNEYGLSINGPYRTPQKSVNDSFLCDSWESFTFLNWSHYKKVSTDLERSPREANDCPIFRLCHCGHVHVPAACCIDYVDDLWLPLSCDLKMKWWRNYTKKNCNHLRKNKGRINVKYMFGNLYQTR